MWIKTIPVEPGWYWRARKLWVDGDGSRREWFVDVVEVINSRDTMVVERHPVVHREDGVKTKPDTVYWETGLRPPEVENG